MQTAIVNVTVAMEIEVDSDQPVIKLDPAVLEDIRTEVAREVLTAADQEAFEEFGLGHYFLRVTVPMAELQAPDGSFPRVCSFCNSHSITGPMIEWQAQSMDPTDPENVSTLKEYQCREDNCGRSFWA